MGMCVAGGAYLPVMTDTVLMTEGSGLFLAGPSLVQAAIGQKTDAGGTGRRGDARRDFRNGRLQRAERSSLPGAAAVAGGQDGRAAAAVPRSFNRVEFDAALDAPKFPAEDVYGLLNPEPGASNVYDMREMIARIVDRSEFDEYKADFGRTVLCGYARIGGHAVGIVANQKMQPEPDVWPWGRRRA